MKNNTLLSLGTLGLLLCINACNAQPNNTNTSNNKDTTNYGPAQDPRFAAQQAKSNQVSQYIRRMFQDKDGNIWFGTNDQGVCKYNGKTLPIIVLNKA